MDDFFPFIHKIEKKKTEELQPLYIELIPPPPQQLPEKNEENPGFIIIEL
jgi:hypothetical protein